MAKKTEGSAFSETDWEIDLALDEQLDRMLATVSGDSTKRESGWRRIERYREEKLLQDRLREVYE